MDVLTLGEALVCLAPPSGRLAGAALLEKSVGGAELNTAVGLARLGNQASWFSRLSTDAVGDAVLAALAAEGVDTSAVIRSGQDPTALMLKDRISEHEVEVLYYRKNSAAASMRPGDLDGQRIQDARAVHATGIGLAIGEQPRELLKWALGEAARLGKVVSFDPNIRPRIISPERARTVNLEVLPFVSDFLCNESEARLISGYDDLSDAAQFIADHGPGTVIIKKGADGALARINGDTRTLQAWPAPHPVDPVGAGDAFNAGWIHARLHAITADDGLRLAAFVAAQVVQHPGDYEGFPHLADIPEDVLAGTRTQEALVSRK